MATITALSGMVDANVFVPGYTPTGTDVGAEFTQLINKINEIVAQLNTNTTAIAANDVDIAANVSAISALDLRATALEGSVGSASLELTSSGTISATQAQNYRYIYLRSLASAITLPSISVVTHPITIINAGVAAGATISVAGGDSAITGTSLPNSLSNGSSITLFYVTISSTRYWVITSSS